MRASAACPAALATLLALAALAFAAPSGGAPAPAERAAKARGELRFSARFDESAGPYVKGSVPFLLVRDASGRDVVRRRVNDRTVVSLPAGRYTLAAYWRPCEGPCQEEDLPTDRCARRFTIHTARRGASEAVTASAVFRGGEPCRLRVESDWPPLPVVRAGKAVLETARGPYCRPSPRDCKPPAAQPETRRRLPVGVRTRVGIDLKLRARRLRLTGICGRGPLTYSAGGRRWSFRVPPETVASMRTCHDIKLTVTYAGPGVMRGLEAVFGFRLRRAG
jgi:hypothetical protein